MTDILFQGIFSFLASLGFGILVQVRGKNLLFSALGGMLGWLVYTGLASFIPDDIIRYFIASVVISHYAQQMAHYRRAPALVFLAIAFIPLVPGYAAYQTMVGLLLSDIPQFTQAAIYTFKVVMAIATGFLISSNVLHPVRWVGHKTGRGVEKS